MTQWVQKIGHTARVNEILARQALLTYDKSPQQTLDFLRNKLGVHFPHQKEQLGVEPNLPTQVDPQWVARATLLQRAFQHPNTDGFEDAALDWLINEKLDGDRRRHLISRMQRPDYASLTQLIMDDFGHPNSGGFGQFAIHKLLTQAQLDDMLKRKPDLINNHHWVVASLTRAGDGNRLILRHVVAFAGQAIMATLERQPAIATLNP